MPIRPPRLRPLLLAVGLLPIGFAAVELAVRAADSYSDGALSRPPCPTTDAVPCPLARHALPSFGQVAGIDPDTGAPHVLLLNSLGLRGGEAAVPKPEGLRRVLLLGDEAVLAAGLPDEDTFAGRLAPTLSAAAGRVEPGTWAEVVNAAIPGDCPLLSVLRLRRLSALQPDLILLCVRPSDLVEDALYRRDLLTDADGRPVACPHPAVVRGETVEAGPRPEWWQESLAVRLAGRALAGPERCPLSGERLSPAADVTVGDPRAALAAEQALAPLAELVRIAEGLHVRAAVIVLPDRAAGTHADQSSAVSLVLAAAADAGLRTCNAAAALHAHEEGAGDSSEAGPSLTPTGELTRAGHVRLAETLGRFLLSAPSESGAAG
ncbi:hypothetical protein [Alienimonas chondri]|uniref:SGNH/GDSL hydrolase family protein n=1 Tax=Alienimonas chondri TaxID=2681879 RepID=A0ABX1VAW5_9PLAN|nr:hypothetical protein [Alienimonas chondri]NNJ25027.1 hypothetical protein [Alienimonas chondri]